MIKLASPSQSTYMGNISVGRARLTDEKATGVNVMSYNSTSNSMLIIHLAAPRSTLSHREQCSLSYPMLKRSRDPSFEFNVKDFISTNLQNI